MDTITNNFDFCKQNKNSEKEEFWNQYLAGLINGDGTLLISKLGYASLEITMDISDEHALQKIKQVLGGSVKARTNAKAFRYRVHHKKGILDLISRINGKIRQTNRKVQLEKICNLYDIACQPLSMLTQQNGWFAGFFDADGSLGFSLKKGWPQLVISAAQKNHVDLLPFQEVFGGIIRLDKRSNAFKWEIYTEKSILNFYYYCQKHPLHSHKKKRMFLVPRFFELRKIRAYRFDASPSLKKHG
jgi:hypothetical protein